MCLEFHANTIPGSPVFGKLAIPIDIADIPLPEGGKKKLNIPLTTPLGNVWK